MISATAEIGGAELSMVPVVEALARERRVVALLPAPGPLEERLVACGAEIAAGFELRASVKGASGSYGHALGAGLVLGAARQQWTLARSLRRLAPSLVYC